MQPDRLVSFMMEDRDALEFTLVLVGYHLLLTGKSRSSLKQFDFNSSKIPRDYRS